MIEDPTAAPNEDESSSSTDDTSTTEEDSEESEQSQETSDEAVDEDSELEVEQQLTIVEGQTETIQFGDTSMEVVVSDLVSNENYVQELFQSEAVQDLTPEE